MRKLMDVYHSKKREYVVEGKYEVAQVFGIADDLTDSLFKGVSVEDGYVNLKGALTNNRDREQSPEIRSAWDECLTILDNFFNKEE